MRTTRFFALLATLLIVSIFAAAQDKNSPKTTIKHVPVARTSPNSGKEMFNNYCAVCHGNDGKGGGPAASALKTPPADLTALAKKNGGKYPSAHVSSVLRGQADLAPHGSQDMPVWGPIFSSISQGHEAVVHQRIANLVKYVESLQEK